MKKFFTHHPFMKALSFGMAFFLWLVIHEEQQTQGSYNVPIEIKNIPSDLVLGEEIDREIRIRVSGPRTQINRIEENKIKPFIIDLANAKRGRNSFSVYEEEFTIPRRTRITRISPQVIRINLERAEERLVRVSPRFIGELAEGYELVQHQISPSAVKVRGPRNALAAVTSLQTEAIDLTGRRESFDAVFSIRPSKNLSGFESEKVTVKVTIRESEISKIVESVPLVVINSKQKLVVEPETIALKLTGPAGKVSELMNEGLKVILDAEKLNFRRKKSLRISPALPAFPGVQILSIPGRVRVSLSEEEG